jgi:hypothetical protein
MRTSNIGTETKSLQLAHQKARRGGSYEWRDIIPSQQKFKNMPLDHDFPEDDDADVFGNDVFGNDVRDISVWEDGEDRSLIEKVVTDAIEVASSLLDTNPAPPPPRATTPASPLPVRPPRTPTGRPRKVLLKQEGAVASCSSRPLRKPPYEQKSPPATHKMEQQSPIAAPTITPRNRKKQHLVLPPHAKRKSATGRKASDSSMVSVVAFPADWDNVSILAQDEVIKSREPGNPQPRHHARRHSVSGATFPPPSLPSPDNAPKPISSFGIRRRSLTCSSDRDNDHFSAQQQVPFTIANKHPSDESSLLSDASDHSKCSPGSRHPRGSYRRSPTRLSVEASHRPSSNQANRTYRRPSRGNSRAGGEQEWSTDRTEAWPMDPSVSSHASTESNATDSSSSAVVKQKRMANRRLSNSSFGENSKGGSQYSGSDAGSEWSHQRRPSASVVGGSKQAFQLRRSSTTTSTKSPCHPRRASSLSRKTARRSSTGNSIDQGWHTDLAEDDSTVDPSGQDDSSKDDSPGIKAGRKNIKKYEKASKDATNGEDSKSRKSSKSKTSRSTGSRSRRPKPASRDQIEEKRDEQIIFSERKVRRSSLRGDKGSSS